MYRKAEEFGNDYTINTAYGGKISPGDFEVTITEVVLEKTKSGHPMAKIKMDVQDTGSHIFYYLVDNRSNDKNIEWSNKRLTKFFDCFCIQRGNFKTNTWIGHKGMVHIGKTKEREDGKSWFEIQYLIVTGRDLFQHNDSIPDITASCEWEDVIDFEKEERGLKADDVF